MATGGSASATALKPTSQAPRHMLGIIPVLRAGAARVLALDTDQRRRHDSDAVRAPVGLRAGGEDDRVEEIIAEVSGEPLQMADIIVAEIARQLELDGEDATVFPLD